MAREIERKFRVNGYGFTEGARCGRLRQGYLSIDPKRVVRVRTGGGKGYLTVKGETNGFTRVEYEYEIPVQDAEEMLDTLCIGSTVEKDRYVVTYQGFTWEIDIFHGDNEGLVIAEIELDNEETSFPKPPWLGPEVSDDIRYFNAELTRNPYKNWGSIPT